LVLKLDQAIDKSGKMLRAAVNQPAGALHLLGTLSRISPPLALNEKLPQLTVLLELTTALGVKVTVSLEESPTLLASSQLLEPGTDLIVTHLKRGILKAPSLPGQVKFASTSDTIIIPIPQNDSVWDPEKAPKNFKLSEPSSSSLLGSCISKVTRLINSKCFEIEAEQRGQCKVYAHRSIFGMGIRPGSLLKFHGVHRLYDQNGGLIGLGLCAQSIIQIVAFSDRYETQSLNLIKVANDRQQLPTFELCVYLEKRRQELSKSCPMIQGFGMFELSNFFFATTRNVWQNTLFSDVSPLTEWLAHDKGTIGSKLGCQAQGIDSSTFPRPIVLSFFSSLASFDTLVSGDELKPNWRYEIINPMAYLEDIRNGMLIGCLRSGSTTPQVQSNYIWFESLTGPNCLVPILVTGALLRHMNVPCRLISFLVAKESTVFHPGVSDFNYVPPRGRFPFGFYLITSIDQVQFLGSVSKEDAIEPVMDHVLMKTPNTQCFRVVRKCMPSWKETVAVSEFDIELFEPVREAQLPQWHREETKKNSTRLSLRFQNTQASPLIQEGASYFLQNCRLTEPSKDDTRTLIVDAPFSIYELPDHLIPAEHLPNSSSSRPSRAAEMAAASSSASSMPPAQPQTVTLRDFLHKKKKASKDNADSKMNVCKVVVLTRNQEPTLVYPEQPQMASRFISGEPKEHRSGAGDVSLLLRALDTPDQLHCYIKTAQVSLPLGLLPGAVLALHGCRPDMKGKSTVNVNIRSKDTRIEFLGFDPGVLKMLGWQSAWPGLEHLPTANSQMKPGLASLQAGEENEYDKIWIDPIGMPRLRSPSLSGPLRQQIPWSEFNVPQKALVDLPKHLRLDRRCFQARLTLQKYYDFTLESRCSSCFQQRRNGMCPHACTGASAIIHTQLVGLVSDGTGVARMTLEDDNVWALLPVPNATKVALLGLVIRHVNIKFGKKELIVGDQLLRAQDLNWNLPISKTQKVLSSSSFPNEEDEDSDDQHDIQDNPDDTLRSGSHSEIMGWDKQYWKRSKLLPTDIPALKTLRSLLIMNVAEPIVAIYKFYAAPRTRFFPFEDLPYHMKQGKTSKEANESDFAKLVKQLPSVDLVWASPLKAEFTKECQTRIAFLRSGVP
jgi:hypothetical protein